jgi:hypothetical protein
MEEVLDVEIMTNLTNFEILYISTKKNIEKAD